MINKDEDLCQHLKWVSVLYQISGANHFQIRSWNRAAQTIPYYLPDLGTGEYLREKLLAIPGIGESIANEILCWNQNPVTELKLRLESSIHPDLLKMARTSVGLIQVASILQNEAPNNRELWLCRLEAGYFSLLGKMKARKELEALLVLKPNTNTETIAPYRGIAIEGELHQEFMQPWQFVFYTHPLTEPFNSLKIKIEVPQGLLNSDEAFHFAKDSKLLPLHYLNGIYTDKKLWLSIVSDVLKNLSQNVLLWYPLREPFLQFCNPLEIEGNHLFLPSWRMYSHGEMVKNHLESIPKAQLAWNATALAILRFLT
ncbi:MAG: hypothetical protein H3C47_04040 [Candidatus Cloacimonetes bacterium]|nr:hypothetical protein [Candidatus Cloacimonadota bacterium]